MNFRKSFGRALVLTLLLSSCSSSTEEATIDTGILKRLNAETGFVWNIRPLNKATGDDAKVYSSEGYIEQLWPDDLMKCIVAVYVFENEEFAKKAEAKFFRGDNWSADYSFWQFKDPVTNYGILLLEVGDPCTEASASTFDFDLPTKN
jgi:hypothetical protein